MPARTLTGQPGTTLPVARESAKILWRGPFGPSISLGRALLGGPAEQPAVEGESGVKVGGAQVDPAGRALGV